MPNQPIVAVINTSPEMIELLKYTLEDEGFRTVGSMITSTTAFKRQEDDLLEFLASESPRAALCRTNRTGATSRIWNRQECSWAGAPSSPPRTNGH